MSKVNKQMLKERCCALAEEIKRIEKLRTETEPGTEKYAALTAQLDALYTEQEKHLTPWHEKTEGKTVIASATITGVTGVLLATFEHWFPIVGKAANHAIANVFRSNNRRV